MGGTPIIYLNEAPLHSDVYRKPEKFREHPVVDNPEPSQYRSHGKPCGVGRCNDYGCASSIAIMPAYLYRWVLPESSDA